MLAWNTFDSAPPTSSVRPLPSESGRSFTVAWAGVDSDGGSGVATYDVYVSAGDESYRLWLSGTVETLATFQGEPGLPYRFFSVARDHAGNRQNRPDEPQAWTFVVTNGPILSLAPDATALPSQMFSRTNTLQNPLAGD